METPPSAALRVLIVDDEAPARTRLRDLLGDIAAHHPTEIIGMAANGVEALRLLEAAPADVVLADIRMPVMDGVELARHLGKLPLPPAVIFVTAYDQYALQAFEQAAVDYLLKPLQAERLGQTCARLRQALSRRATPAPADVEGALAQLRALLGAPGLGVPATPSARLSVIQAGSGPAIHLVPVAEVIYFEAADKYVRVITAGGEHLIRTSLRELLPQLDPERFWQVHRGTVVRADAIATALRDEAGKLTLTLRGHADRLGVSRLYAHRFRPM